MVVECQQKEVKYEWSYVMTRASGRSNFADAPFLRTFFQTDVSVVFFLVVPLVTPIDEEQVHPCFVVAALIMCAQTESLSRNGKCAMFVYFPELMGTKWLQKTTDIRPIVRNRSRSPQWCGAPRRR